MEKRHLIRQNIENRLKERYELFTGRTFDRRPHFRFKDLIFRIDTIGSDFNGIVVEYALNEKQAANNLFEDGDCFNIDDMTEDQIFLAVITEVEGTSV